MSETTILLGSGRCTGKTTRAIKLARAFDATLIEPDKARARHAENVATRNMHAVIPVRTWDEFISSPGRDVTTNVVIDGADTILERLLGCNVAAMTVNASALEGDPCGS